MAITNFLSTVWSARINENLKKQLVYGNCVNTDYEGEITDQGQTVKINAIGEITIGDYNKSTGMGIPEELTDSSVSLVIDQAKFFNFRVDDIDRAQANADIMDAAMRDAAHGLANAADQYIASLYVEVDPANTIGDDTNPVVLDKTNVFDYLVDLSILLDEANVPDLDRFVVVPAWVYGLLLKDDRFAYQPDVLRTGYVGEISGMAVYKSNNVPVVNGKYKIMAGYRGAIAFAGQINKVEAFRPEQFFADAVKGLYLFGAKVIKPKGIAVLTAAKA